jgi:tetratricopeptide (TPR) repeat protein
MAQNPLIYTYLKKYQEDPTSRVFGPLAEAYRKAGLYDEAIEVAREGLKIHPNFIAGRVSLARALFDKKLYLEVLEELFPIAQDIPDNLVAQKLLAESCLLLGRTAEALSAYKMLLYYSPQDPETAQIVRELEGQAYDQGTLILRTDPVQGDKVHGIQGDEAQYDIRPLGSAIGEDPDEKQRKKVSQIENLQKMLQNVERYRKQRADFPRLR